MSVFFPLSDCYGVYLDKSKPDSRGQAECLLKWTASLFLFFFFVKDCLHWGKTPPLYYNNLYQTQLNPDFPELFSSH